MQKLRVALSGLALAALAAGAFWVLPEPLKTTLSAPFLTPTRPSGLQLSSSAAQAPAQDVLRTIPRLTVDEAHAIKDAVYVDVRILTEYEKAHIQGALSVPFAEFDRRSKELPEGHPLILYCT